MSINATLIVQMIVFAILVWFTMKFVWPPITAALDERARKIADGLSAADKAKADLAAANSRVEQQLSAARDDAAKRLAEPSAWRSRSSRRPRAAPTTRAPRSSPPPSPKPPRRPSRPARRCATSCRAGGQGCRADPAQGSQRVRACRPAGSPEVGTLTMAELATIARPTPKPCSRPAAALPRPSRSMRWRPWRPTRSCASSPTTRR